MDNWYMLTLVGRDQPGIVAHLSTALCKGGCNLGESSMAKLGNNFSIMLMAQFAGTAEELDKIIAPVAESLELHRHVDQIEGGHDHLVQPNVRISVYCADRPGIMEEVTGTLAKTGFNILNLDSNIGSQDNLPTYYIHIEGFVPKELESIYEAMETLSKEKNMQIQVIPIDTLLK